MGIRVVRDLTDKENPKMAMGDPSKSMKHFNHQMKESRTLKRGMTHTDIC